MPITQSALKYEPKLTILSSVHVNYMDLGQQGVPQGIAP